MADRKFKQINVEVFASGPPSLIEVSWTFEESVIPASRYTIGIFRGESPEEMEPIVSGLPAELYSSYDDRSALLRSNRRTYYYKVVATNKQTNAKISSNVQTWDGDLDYVGLYIITEHNFKFRHISGTPFCIFKKHTDSPTKCPDCWDPIAQRVTKSNCQTCHGTGNIGKGVGGYHNPTLAWIEMDPESKVLQATEWGRREPSQTDVLMSNYPFIVEGDLFVELKTDKRWEVIRIHETEKRRTKMLQTIRLTLLDKDAVEYTIDIPEAVKRTAVRELSETKKIPEF